MAEIDSKILICMFLLLWAFGRKSRTNEMPIDPSHVKLFYFSIGLKSLQTLGLSSTSVQVRHNNEQH